MTTPSIRAWLELLRISNLPTVLSNAIAGAAIGTVVRIVEDDGGFRVTLGETVVRTDDRAPAAWQLLAALLVPSLCYGAGMILNDVSDADVDAREQPNRPIPSGRVARNDALRVGCGLLVVALILALMMSFAVFLTTAMLCCAVIVYDCWHTKSIWSTALLALCRALASLVPMLACSDGDLELLVRRGAIVLPLALAAWTLGLSLVARGERSTRVSNGATGLPAACPTCGHLLLANATSCSECARASVHADRLAHVSGRRVWKVIALTAIPVVGTIVIYVALVHAFTTLMQAHHAYNDPLEKLPLIAGFIMWCCIGVAVRAQWTMRRDARGTPVAVGTWIACLALVDAMALAILGAWALSAVCILLFAVTVRWQRAIAGS